MLPGPVITSSRPASFTDLTVLRTTRKGKEKDMHLRPQTSLPMHIPIEMGEGNRAPKAWWLDVSSPTWEDMRAIGKVNNLLYIWE
jgi:magnesium transporter